MLEEWKVKDPVDNYEDFLKKQNIIDEMFINKTRENFNILVDKEWEISYGEPQIIPDILNGTDEIYAPENNKTIHTIKESKEVNQTVSPRSNKRFIGAISDALSQCLEHFPELILMGQDIAEYGGVFKVTEGLVDKFGKARIRNTPLCESAIIGSGLGYSIMGGKSVIEMQFADFISSGFTQVINNLAKIYFRWGQNADVVIRMPTGAGVGAGPFHSQSNEAWFTHTPGLKVVYPSNPFDAKGLLIAAIEDPNPVMYFEHKALYRTITEEIPDDYYSVEIGKAKIEIEGEDVSIITYGMGVIWAKQVLKESGNISADLIDLRSLMPWDKEAVMDSVKKTGKVMILHEDNLTGGFGGEIAAWISEHCFEYLDAPVVRSGSLDTPVPFASSLENNFLPVKRFEEQLEYLLRY